MRRLSIILGIASLAFASLIIAPAPRALAAPGPVATEGCSAVGTNFTISAAAHEYREAWLTGFIAGDTITFQITRTPVGGDGAILELFDSVRARLVVDGGSAATSTVVYTVLGNYDYALGLSLNSIDQNISVIASCVAAPSLSPQTITFNQPADTTYGTGPVTLSATATSGLAVSFSSATTPVCTVSGTIATLVGVGTCTITASQAGNASYAAAPDIVQTFAVGKVAQTISFIKPADVLVGAGPVTLSATATSGLGVSFLSATTGVCTVSGTIATLVGVGTCTITASQAGNASFAAAPDIVQTFAVGKVAQTISFIKPADVQFAAAATIPLTATASSGLAVTFVSQTTSVCTVSGATAVIVGVGACAITASQAGDANYIAAPPVTQSFNTLGKPIVTANATVSPGTFSRAGMSLVFTVTLANAGNVAATGLLLTDARLGTLTCALTTLAVGGTVACTGSTVTTAADLMARSLSIAPQVTYSYGAVTATITLSVSVAATVDVAAIQAATKSAIQSLLSQRANVLTTSNPDTERRHERVSGGTLFGGETGSADTGAPVVGFGTRGSRSGAFERYGLGENPSRSGFAGGSGDDRFAAVAKGPFDRFARGARDVSGRPGADLAAPSIFAQAGPDNAPTGPRASPLGFGFSGTGDDNTGRFQFSASLSKFRAEAEARAQEKRANLDPLSMTAMGLSAGPDVNNRSRPALFDVWLEGSSSYFRTDRPDGTRNGHAAIVWAGADMLVRPGLLVGIMAQVDWMADNSSVLGQERDGRGWMAGPYVSAHLTPHLYFDARAAFGRSSNHVDPTGAYVDTFATTRALASAKLTGDWSSGAWRFRPSAEVIWFKETQLAYDNAIGISIASNTYNLGRAIFGPEVSYQWSFADKTMLEPFIGLKGVWDFSRTAETTAAGEPVNSGTVRGRVETGLTFRMPAGISIRTTAAYDGIGATGYHAIQGQAKVVVPLQ